MTVSPASTLVSPGAGGSRLQRFGTIALIVGSAWPAPLVTLAGLTLTGDRLLGLVALPVFAVLALRKEIRWTAVHVALGVFVAVQILTTALNAHDWSQGPKFVTVYVLGFACFALAAEWTRTTEARRWMVGSWLAIAALVAGVGAVSAHLSNFYQQAWATEPWRTAVAQRLFRYTPDERLLIAPTVTFREWNLYSSFLIVPFTLGLWAWRREPGGQLGLVAAVATIVFGLVAGVTRAAWLGMVGVVALWCALRRPRALQVAALALMVAAALLVQALALGTSPVWPRLLEKRSGVGRVIIGQTTLESWRDRPVLGQGAGATTRLSAVWPTGRRVKHLWQGNIGMFVLHDSGILGLAALLGLGGVVAWYSTRVLRRAAGGGPAVPLLIGFGALALAYQFTHGLWLMYPYVCLGFLTAAMNSASPDA